jgi:glycosyltransferase involved in cell wall biosynthesis
MSRIALIGPVRPYRGGISRYTGQLHDAIREPDARLTISYSRQYPGFMYPGGSDREPEPHVYLPAVEYILDSANPLTWPGVGRRIRAFNPDLIIVQWWHVYWAPFLAWIKRFARREGTRMVVICHNFDDHESAKWKILIRNLALRGCAEFLVHSTLHAELIRKSFPEASVRMHPHPTFDALPDPDQVLKRRAKTELLFFGLIRHYKGLDILLRALVNLADLDFHLTVAGESWNGMDEFKRIIHEGSLSAKVEMINCYVPDRQAANLFARADAVVLPYRSASGSGVAAHAFNYLKPVIASDVGGLSNIVVPGKTGMLVEPENIEALASALRRVMESDDHHWYERDAIAEINKRLSWSSLVAALKRGRCGPEPSLLSK